MIPGLVSRLKSEVSAVDGRVYPVRLPQNPRYPALTYELISDPRRYSGDGDDGLVEARMQVSGFADRYGALREALDEVAAALSGFTGDLGGTSVAMIRHEGTRDLFDDRADEDGIYHAASDYVIEYKLNGAD